MTTNHEARSALLDIINNAGENDSLLLIHQPIGRGESTVQAVATSPRDHAIAATNLLEQLVVQSNAGQLAQLRELTDNLLAARLQELNHDHH